ncbi:dienelactone hydrolase family protein [Chromobacterium sp. IIBBL 290-4]|uniref:dienelactone hydrolase family protein n=1 Tax=Chromobacterium sp. IIBBL 290-4 TaxID=2953890 RepID=UPI0020B72757|nr:dienelactone hydrolase family protein [Chromobacterium sp. IIBBL 290-4]UTH74419.1 dienelactone hydrolase family protein [Chromobacterium sp. IIBBL 290-4]
MSHQETDPTRRALLAGAGAVGFALAIQPVSASAIFTDSQALQTGAPDIDTGKGVMGGYYAKPDKAAGPLPLVIVIQEIFGVHAHIQDLCRRLAKQGYFAVAPELYFRHGDPAKIADIDTLMRDLVRAVPDAEVQSDLDATWRWAGAHGADLKRGAVTGFCWGGRQTWLYAARNPDLRAAVAWYGKLEAPANDITPRHPLDIVKELKTPVLGLYGGQDKGIPLESVEKMRAALQSAGKEGEIVIYPDADHAFNADYRPSYNAPAAQDGWKRMLDWFARHGAH